MMTESTAKKDSDCCSPVLDIQRLTKLLGPTHKRANAIVGILNSVIDNHCTPIDEARDALTLGDHTQAAQTIHNLKGCIANLGGIRVFEVAGTLEEQLRTGLPNNATAPLLNTLENELKAFLHAAEQWLDKVHIPNAGNNNAPVNDFQLQQFKNHLHDNNLLAYDCFENMHTYLQRCLTASEFTQLHHAMDLLDFKTAAEVLNTVNIPSSGAL